MFLTTYATYCGTSEIPPEFNRWCGLLALAAAVLGAGVALEMDGHQDKAEQLNSRLLDGLQNLLNPALDSSKSSDA